MKKNGKLLTLLLAVLMSAVMLMSASGLEIFIIASSDEYEDYATSAKYLEILDILKGYDDGELHLDAPILRYQAALFFSRVVTGVVDDSIWGSGASKTFSDVPEYGAVIDMIADMDLIRGYGNGKFGYNDGIRYQDMCAMLLRALGYETQAMIDAYPMSYILKVKDLGLDLNDVMPGDTLNRGQVAQMVYDALVTEISETNDETLDLIVKILTEKNGEEEVDETKDTYLERNFDVSERMSFMIVATENYKMFSDMTTAEEGYFTAIDMASIETDDDMNVTYDEWTFPIDGEAVNGVTEGDLIGKVITLVFDDKTPTMEEFDDEETIIVHAEMGTADVYENLGELSYVKFDKKVETLTLGAKKVAFDGENDPAVLTYNEESGNKEVVFASTIYDNDGLNALMEANTYFRIEAYDNDEDGEYDLLVYVPYEFGQFANRTYSGESYVMVGEYSETPVWDISSSTAKTDANKTYFVEKFLVSGRTASPTTSYRPADTTLRVSEDASEYSLNATVTGDEIATGDFMLYAYNKFTNELYVAENLGTYKTGVLTGIKTGSETVSIDGAAMTVGIAGNIADANGLLVGDAAFASIEDKAKTIIANSEIDEENVVYIEYDTKLVYLEGYGTSDIVTGSDYAIIDIEATLEAALEEDADAWDIPLDGTSATVKRLDTATGALYDINVELLVSQDNSELKFAYADEKYVFDNWDDNLAYNTFKANGYMYAITDEDEDGLYELYAYGSDECNIIGAKIIPGAGDDAEVSFTYNKSNKFIDVNNVGITTDRVTTNETTVSIIIGQDGYIVYKGALGTTSEKNPNELYLSEAASVLAANSDQFIIFDPAGYVAEGVDANVYKNVSGSVWNTDSVAVATGVSYYMMLADSVYIDSSVKLDESGDIVEDEDGNALYVHSYLGLYDLVSGFTKDVDIVTTDIEAPATGVINSINGVIKVDADNNEATITSFDEVYVTNGDYSKGVFSVLRNRTWLSFTTQAKGNKPGVSLTYNSNSDGIYQELNALSFTFVDLDEGAAVDPEEYSYRDSYVFYNSGHDGNYTVVDLEDRKQGEDYSISTVPVKRNYYSATDYTSQAANGAVTPGLDAGITGKIAGQPFFSRNGLADYLIPAVDVDGNTIWRYEGSLRVRVTYYFYINYDEDAKTVDAVVVRVGVIEDEPIGSDDIVPDVGELMAEAEAEANG